MRSGIYYDPELNWIMCLEWSRNEELHTVYNPAGYVFDDVWTDRVLSIFRTMIYIGKI